MFRMTADNTNLTERFEVRHDHSFASAAGCVSLEEAAAAVSRAIVAAREQGIKRLCMDARALQGFSSPNLADRYFISRGWAMAADRQVELALVLEPHLLDPERFGIVVANNMGMRANVFANPSEALTWLVSDQP